MAIVLHRDCVVVKVNMEGWNSCQMFQVLFINFKSIHAPSLLGLSHVRHDREIQPMLVLLLLFYFHPKGRWHGKKKHCRHVDALKLRGWIVQFSRMVLLYSKLDIEWCRHVWGPIAKGWSAWDLSCWAVVEGRRGFHIIQQHETIWMSKH